MQLPFSFTIPKVEWTPPKLANLPSWANAKRIAVDVETRDPNLRDGGGVKGMGPGNFRPGCHIIGIAFAIEDGPAHYLPIRHEGGDNLDVEHTLAYVRDQAKSFTGRVVGANLGYDLGFLERDDIQFTNPGFDPYKGYLDVINAAVCIYELYDRYSLDAILEREGMLGKDDSILNEFAKAYGIDPKKEMYKLPGRAAAQYAIRDVTAPLELHRRQERRIEEEGIQRVWEMETAVLPILVKMRRRGIRVNLGKLEAITTWAKAKAQERLDEAAMLSGVRVHLEEVWKAAAVAKPLVKMGYKVPTTGKKEGPSITGEFLDRCDAVGKALGRARDYSKVLQFSERTYRYQVKGRIHPVFHQLRNTKDANAAGQEETKGARFGRFSGEHPNMQQEFGRDDEFGGRWRDIYESEPGSFLVSSDWSQQEPRFAVHYAEKLGLPGAREFADRYRSDPTTDCHQLLADESGIARKIVKNYFNGSIYGMGEAKLCRALGHPTQLVNKNGKVMEVPGPAGRELIDRIKAKVPWVFLLTREAAKQAEKKGCVWTLDGRKCNFPKDSQGNYDWTHKAFSRIGQGGAAGQMKLTLVAADKAGVPVQLIVHDEFVYSETNIKRAKELKRLQQETLPLSVPMQVDQEYGPAWGSVAKWEKGGEQYLREAGFLDG